MVYPIYVNGSTCFPNKNLRKEGELCFNSSKSCDDCGALDVSPGFFVEDENDDLQKKAKKKAANCVFFSISAW